MLFRKHIFEISPAFADGRVALHLGCGHIHLKGWTNIDSRDDVGADVVDDVFALPSFSPESVDVIYASHVLEHSALPSSSTRPGYLTCLHRWSQVLKPGGLVFVSVPDFRAVARAIMKFDGRKEQEAFWRALFGGQEYPDNYHYCGFTRKSLTSALCKTGFCHIQEFIPFVDDTTKFSMFGIRVSLNLVGIKS